MWHKAEILENPVRFKLSCYSSNEIRLLNIKSRQSAQKRAILNKQMLTNNEIGKIKCSVANEIVLNQIFSQINRLQLLLNQVFTAQTEI